MRCETARDLSPSERVAEFMKEPEVQPQKAIRHSVVRGETEVRAELQLWLCANRRAPPPRRRVQAQRS